MHPIHLIYCREFSGKLSNLYWFLHQHHFQLKEGLCILLFAVLHKSHKSCDSQTFHYLFLHLQNFLFQKFLLHTFHLVYLLQYHHQNHYLLLQLQYFLVFRCLFSLFFHFCISDNQNVCKRILHRLEI